MPKTEPLRFATRLHPSPTQDARLRAMWTTLLAAQHALTLWLRHRAGGGTSSLLAIASGQSGGLIAAPHRARVQPTLAQINDEIRCARDALGWAQVLPASALRWMAAETAREWRAAGERALPDTWPPTRAPELQLDNSVQLIDAVTLMIAPLVPDDLVTADLYLPGPYWQALLRRHQRRQAHEQARHERLERAWLDGSDRGAAAELLARRAHVGRWAAGIQPDLPDPSPGDPISRERVTLRRIAGDGLPARWVVEWLFDASSVGSTRWSQSDVLGVDLGYHHPFACAARGVTLLTPRPFRGSFAPPPLLLRHAHSAPPRHESWARGQHRRAMFIRLLPILEAHLHLALQYRAVAVERMAWSGFARRGFPFCDYALDVGLVAWLAWLNALAPQSGVTVLRVPPAYTTRTCSACRRRAPRPPSRQPFRCAGCGHIAPADLNAASVIRNRGWALLRRP